MAERSWNIAFSGGLMSMSTKTGWDGGYRIAQTKNEPFVQGGSVE